MSWKNKLSPVKGSVFDKPKYKAVDPRVRFLENVRAQLALFKGANASTIKQKQTWSHDEDSDKYRLAFKFGNTAVKVNGEGEDDEGVYVVEYGDAEAVFNGVIEEAEAGAFDEQLTRLSREFTANLANARAKPRKKKAA